MAASAFQSTNAGHARITVASPTGIEAGSDGDFLCLRGRVPQSDPAELD